MDRLTDVVRFYALLAELERRLGGTRTLATFDKYRDLAEPWTVFIF
jgi:hypothetical protein